MFIRIYKYIKTIEITKNHIFKVGSFIKKIINELEKRSNNHDMSKLSDDENKNKLISIKNKQKVGVVIGGPPCQGFSMAGWRNPDDKRNQLFKDFVDIVKNIKPEFFVLENVPGILSMRKGEAIKEIIK